MAKFNTSPHFDLTTFTKRPERPIRISWEEVERHTRDFLEYRLQNARALGDKPSPILQSKLLETVIALRETLGEELFNPSEMPIGVLYERPEIIAGSVSAEAPELERGRLAEKITQFIATETARRILWDILGKDPHEMVERKKRVLRTYDHYTKNSMYKTLEVLEKRVRNDLGIV